MSMHQLSKETNVNVIEDARQLVDSASKRNITVRIMGATGYHIHCEKNQKLFKLLGRKPSMDIDIAAPFNQIDKIANFLKESNFAMQWGITLPIRKKFSSDTKPYTVDVFLDKLDMCHTIELKNRLPIDYPTIPLADLLLEKLQIVNITQKDIQDMLVLLVEHEFGDNDNNVINGNYIASLLSKDWGFYYTATTNLNKALQFTHDSANLDSGYANTVSTKVKSLLTTLEAHPKSAGWKIRAKVGTRKIWYKNVESIE